MFNCPFCNHELEEETLYCHYCKNEIPPLDSLPDDEITDTSSMASVNRFQVVSDDRDVLNALDDMNEDNKKKYISRFSSCTKKDKKAFDDYAALRNKLYPLYIGSLVVIMINAFVFLCLIKSPDSTATTITAIICGFLLLFGFIGVFIAESKGLHNCPFCNTYISYKGFLYISHCPHCGKKIK